VLFRSSSGGAFCPDQVILSDDESYPIEVGIYQNPKFQDGEDYAVQQGAGMVVTKASEKEIYASVQFLKWFTQEDRNIEFSSLSSYLPVKKKANNATKIQEAVADSQQSVKDTLTVAVKTVQENETYTPSAVKNGTSIRSLLESALTKKAQEDGLPVEQAVSDGESYEKVVFQIYYG
jgi:multiple sugar transport system substrate-binding protein